MPKPRIRGKRICSGQHSTFAHRKDSFNGAIGATREALYCRLLPPCEIDKLFRTHEMVGRGGGDRTQRPEEVGQVEHLP